MTIDPDVRRRIEITFRPLNRQSASRSLPPPASLSKALADVSPHDAGDAPVPVTPEVAAKFATAAVEMWMRAVHSFLMSTSLTDASPLWASVTGYYSSHYSVRALAHLLGHFQLFHARQIVQIELQGGRHLCSYRKKGRSDREHKFYWSVVRQDSHFASDPLFTDNNRPNDDDEPSDVGHRDHANYADHIDRFPTFRPLDDEALRRRVQFIAQMGFDTPPIPRRSRFPDNDSVQVVAYHRIVRFRQFLDEIIGEANRFWKFHRTPTWTSGMIDFQLAEQRGLGTQQR